MKKLIFPSIVLGLIWAIWYAVLFSIFNLISQVADVWLTSLSYGFMATVFVLYTPYRPQAMRDYSKLTWQQLLFVLVITISTATVALTPLWLMASFGPTPSFDSWMVLGTLLGVVALFIVQRLYKLFKLFMAAANVAD